MSCCSDHQRFDHFVVTRFGVRLPDLPPPTSAWLARRLELFERFTVPSVSAQTCSIFTWLVFCDAPAADWLGESFGRIGVRAEVIPVEGVFDSGTVSSSVAQRRRHAVLTTRLDSDDAVGKDFVRLLHENASPDVFEALNFTHGFQVAGRLLYRRSDPSNAFISLTEPITTRSPRTVFAVEHQQWLGAVKMRQIASVPLWLQVVHEGNLANTARGIMTGSVALEPQFGSIELQIQAVSPSMRLRSWILLISRVVSRPSRLAWAWRVILASLDEARRSQRHNSRKGLR
jgi:hypothetical protein